MIIACWDSAELRMIFNDRNTAFKYVDRSNRRRDFLEAKETKKLDVANDYSTEMNPCDAYDFSVFLRKMMIQSENWTLYPTCCLHDYAGVSAFALHAMLVEAWQKQHKSARLTPYSRADFYARLADLMMNYTAPEHTPQPTSPSAAGAPPNPPPLGKYGSLGESPVGQRYKPKATAKAAARSTVKAMMEVTGDKTNRFRQGIHSTLPVPSSSPSKRPAGKVCQFCRLKSALHYCTQCNVYLHSDTSTRQKSNTAGTKWPCHGLYHDPVRHSDPGRRGLAYEDWLKVPANVRPAWQIPAEIQSIQKSNKIYGKRANKP
jgi:hypothetical protein